MGKKKLYELTDEHRAQLKPWADRWIANAMSTKSMTDADRDATRDAIRGLYRAANLTPPPDNRIVFVPSPFVMRFAGGFAAGIWYQRKTGSAATMAATESATMDATESATWAATMDATRAATMADTWAATWAPISTRNWYSDIVPVMHQLAKSISGTNASFLLGCAYDAYNMWNGGNQWSGYSAYISFFRHVSKLGIDYSKWKHYEDAALVSGPRIMHEKFCIISDRPSVLLVDEQNRPHCETGPFCQWRDGTSLYSIHGVRVPQFVVENPESITLRDIDEETNQEVRRIMIDRFGVDRYMREGCAKLIDSNESHGKLWTKQISDDEPITMLEVLNSTPEPDGSIKIYFLRVPPTMRSAAEARAWTFGFDAKDFNPSVET